MRSAALVLALGLLAHGQSGCGDDLRALTDGSARDAGAPDALPPDGLSEFDSKSKLIRGPYLQVPTQTSMTVAWATDLPSTSRVEYGLTPAYGQAAAGRTYRYDYGIDGNPPNGWQHEVTLAGLQPATTYYYRVVSIEEPTADLSFHTAVAPGESFRVAIWGDTRSDHAVHQSVVDALQPYAPDLALFTGDFVNNGGLDGEWAKWFEIEAPFIARVPFLPAIGNHELFGYKGGPHYDHFFIGPPRALYDAYGDKSARTYAFDYGSLHVLTLDPYGDWTEMIEFIDADLASPEATAAKFRIILMHPPMYTFSYHRAEGPLRDVVMPRARAAGVQLVATGHNHVYERFWLGDLQQIVTGGGGGYLHEINSSSGPVGRLPDEPSLRVAAFKEHTFVIGDFAGDLATFRVFKPDGAQIDCFQIDATQQPPQNLACPLP